MSEVITLPPRVVSQKGSNLYITISQGNPLDLAKTLDCGQAFRWSETAGKWRGVAGGREMIMYMPDDETLIFENTEEAEYISFWRHYLDLDRDYAPLIAAAKSDPLLYKIIEYGRGLRLMNQDGFEAICSFIISQNNNIPRIKGIIGRLCESFGDPLPLGGYTFPTAARLAPLSREQLSPLRAGFRDKYILDAAAKIESGEVAMTSLYTLCSDDARGELMKIKGIGPKVADCALLFGFGHIDCLPKDVWIKRALAELFPGGLPENVLPFAGLVQQYIFLYMRETSK